MDKTKKNGILKAAACVFGSTMLMTCVLGGTLAKYASTADSVSGEVKVATWNVTAEADKTETTEVVKWEVNRCNGYEGTLVKDEANDNNGIACPGTWGYAKVNLVNNGEVAADVTITQTPGTEPSDNIHYYVGAASGPITETSVESLEEINSTIPLKQNESKEIVIAYVWDYDTDQNDGANDTDDTDLQNGTLNVLNGSMTISAVQSKTSNDLVTRS